MRSISTIRIRKFHFHPCGVQILLASTYESYSILVVSQFSISPPKTPPRGYICFLCTPSILEARQRMHWLPGRSKALLHDDVIVHVPTMVSAAAGSRGPLVKQESQVFNEMKHINGMESLPRAPSPLCDADMSDTLSAMRYLNCALLQSMLHPYHPLHTSLTAASHMALFTGVMRRSSPWRSVLPGCSWVAAMQAQVR